MPSPYADPNKLAKKLQEEARKIQEARNEIQARIKETELIIKSLEKLGIDTSKSSYNLKQILVSSTKNALDVDSIRNSIDVLREEIGTNFNDFIKKVVVPDLKKLASNFSDTNFESEIKNEISKLESDHSLQEIPGLIDGLLNIANQLTVDIRCPEGKPLLANFSECIDFIINVKKDYFQKIQNLLLEASKYEAFHIKNKVNLSSIEDLKNRARENYRNLKFNAALESMRSYLDALKEKTTEYLQNSLNELQEKIDKISSMGVNTEELSSYLKSLDLTGSNEPLKIQLNLKKINDQLDTLYLDYAIKRLSVLNGKVDSISIESLREKFSKELEIIRNLLKSQRIEESIKSMEDLEKGISELENLIKASKEEISTYEGLFDIIDAPIIESLRGEFNNFKGNNIDPYAWLKFKSKLEEVLSSFSMAKVEEIQKAQKYVNKKFDNILVNGFNASKLENNLSYIQQLLKIEKEIMNELIKKLDLLQQDSKELSLNIDCTPPKGNLRELMETFEKCNSKFNQAVEEKIDGLKTKIESHVLTLSSINKKYSRIISNINRINELSDRIIAARLLNGLNSKFEAKLSDIYKIISSSLGKKTEFLDTNNLDKALVEVYKQFSSELKTKTQNISLKIKGLKYKALGFSKNPETDEPEKLLSVRLQAGLDELSRLSWFRQLSGTNDKSGTEDPLKTISENLLILYYTNKISTDSLLNVLCLKEANISGINDLTPEAILERAKEDELKRFLNLQQFEGTLKEAISKKINTIFKENNVDSKVQISILSELEKDPVATYFKALNEISKVNGEYILAEVTNVILMYTSIDFIRNLLVGDVNFANKYDSLVLRRITYNDYLGAYIGLYDILKDYIQILGLIKLTNNYHVLFVSDSKFGEAHGNELKELQSSIQRLDLQTTTTLLSELIEKYNEFKSESAKAKVESSWKLARGIMSANLFIGGGCQVPIPDLTEMYRHILERNSTDLKNLADMISMEISLKIGTTEKLGEYLYVEKVNILDEIERNLNAIMQDSENALESFIDEHITPLYFPMSVDVSDDINQAYKNILKYHESLKEGIKTVAIKKNERFSIFFNSELDYSSLFLEILMEEILPEGFRGQIADEKKINKRFEELLEKGYNPEGRTLEVLQSISQRLKPEIEITYMKEKGNKAFKLHLNISNKGNWKLYDASVIWLDQEQFIGDINPGSSIDILYDYTNRKDEPIKVIGELLDMTMYEKIITVGKLITYIRENASYRQICASCRGYILKGMDMIKCEYCGSSYHFKCAERAKSCKVCGIEFDI